MRGRIFVTSSGTDTVGKKIAAQGLPLRVFDPSFKQESDLSDAKTLTRMRDSMLSGGEAVLSASPCCDPAGLAKTRGALTRLSNHRQNDQRVCAWSSTC